MKRIAVVISLTVLAACQPFDKAFDDCVASGACRDGGTVTGGGTATGGGASTGGGAATGGGVSGGGLATGGGEPTGGGPTGGGPTGGGPTGGGAATYALTPMSISFTAVLSNTVVQQLRITNQTGTTVTPSLQLGGADSMQFGLNSTCPSLSNGEVCIASLTFHPTGSTLAQRSGEVLIQGGGASAMVPLTGIVEAPLTFSTTALDFGSITVNNIASRQLTVTNKTSTTLSPIYAVAGGSVYSRGPGCMSLAASEVCSFDVSFRPADAGVNTDTLNVTAAMYATAISMTGVGVQPGQLTLTQSPFAGAVADAGSALVRPFTMTNNGVTTIPSIAVSVTGDPEFSVTNPGCTSLDAGGQCTGQLRFAPTAHRAYAATLWADAGLSGVATSSLSANGYEAARLQFFFTDAGAAVSTDDFGNGNQDVSHLVYVRNTSSGPATGLMVSLSGAPVFSFQDAGVGQCALAGTLASGAQCHVVIRFGAGQSGQPAGPFSATLTAAASSGTPMPLSLNGTASYSWSPSDAGYLTVETPSGVGPPTSTCTTRNLSYWEYVADAGIGVQFLHVNEPAFDAVKCTNGDRFYQVPARGSTRYPGRLRLCGGGTEWPSWDKSPPAVGEAPYLCLSSVFTGDQWSDGQGGARATCLSNASTQYIALFHECL